MNDGIIRGHEDGVVTAASLMVRGAQAGHAAAYSRRHPAFSTGIHFEFGQWAYSRGEWRPSYEVVPPEDAKAVRHEAEAQLQAFYDLLGRAPTHLDSHQHFHRRDPFKSALEVIARDLGVPLRGYGDIHFVGGFYGQTAEGEPLAEGISPEAFLGLVATTREGVSELSCHPATAADTGTVYDRERLVEFETLCDPRLRQELKRLGVELVGF